MKRLASARIEQEELPNGQVRLRIRHDVLRGVTPDMLVWWWRNIEGEIEIDGQRHPRYLVWHPVDHIHFDVHARLADGSVGAGAIFHVVEALGADLQHLIDALLHLKKLDLSGAVVEMNAFGQPVLRIEGDFLPVPGGTQVATTMTIGFAAWPVFAALNRWLIARRFPPDRRAAWLRHSVEEIGNLEFFLPELYRTQQVATGAPFRAMVALSENSNQ